MSRYIDIEPYEKDGWYLQRQYRNSYGESIVTAPLALVPTAETVVRCKDCKWYNEEDLFCWYWAELYGYADATPRITPFDYCFRGVRKEGVEE